MYCWFSVVAFLLRRKRSQITKSQILLYLAHLSSCIYIKFKNFPRFVWCLVLGAYSNNINSAVCILFVTSGNSGRFQCFLWGLCWVFNRKKAQASRSFVSVFTKHKIFFKLGNVLKDYKIHISKRIFGWVERS